MKEETIKKIEQQAEQDITYRINETGEYREAWRIFRIMAEFVEGYQFLSSLKKEVTVLGSARTPENDRLYKDAQAFGKLLAENGYTTITGGGPGIMEAANRGATEGNGESVGLNIQLPFEQRINPYVRKSAAFYYFFTRKVMLTSPAHAFVFFPGGFGTMDEFFEVVDHISLGKMCEVPIILYDSSYWGPLLDFLKTSGCNLVGSITEEKINQWHVVDTPEAAFRALHETEAITDYQACELSVMNFHSSTPRVDWRIFHIMAELVEGFDFLTGLVDDVTILGTKSIAPDSPYYAAAHTLGMRLAEDGYAVVTGGAPGVAEAANRGAFEAGGTSIGIGMEVAGKTRMNAYVNKSISFKFPFTRKLIVTAPSKAFVFFPGGFGTMHQFFEVLTLIQTKKMQKVPIVLFDHNFWQPLHEVIKKIFVHEEETISDEDDELYEITDDIERVLEMVNDFRGRNGVKP